jgi:hypothetical protein
MKHPPQRIALVTALSLATAAPRAFAQSTLHIGGRTATHGVRNFRPDTQSGPVVIPVETGGTLDALTSNLGSRCFGWITPQPDFILRVRANVPALRFSVVTDASAGGFPSLRDTTLVVNSADGRWHCDDDSGGYPDPRLLLTGAGVGQYDIWVGSYRSGAVVRGELRVEAVPFVQTGGSTAALGVRELAADAAPDTLDLQLPSRPAGDIDANTAGASCLGRVPAQPDLIVRVPSAIPLLRATFTATADTTLLVHTPGGEWRCDDNSEGTNPALYFQNAAVGTYELWVGAKSEGNVTGRLSVTRAPLVETGGSAASMGVREVRADLQPDPVTLDVPAHPSGSAQGRMISPSCGGVFSARPDLIVRLPAALPFLRTYATSTVDTVLMVHTPEGSWRCNDDSYGGINPTVDLRDASAGQYEVWLGSYRSGTNLAGQLHLTLSDSRHP